MLKMKLVTYTLKNDVEKKEKVGVLTADESQVVDLQAANGKPSPYFENMIAFLEGGKDAHALAKELLEKAGNNSKTSLDNVTLLAPLKPRTMRDCMCFENHIINGNKQFKYRNRGIDPDTLDPKTFLPSAAWYEAPTYYKVNVNSIVGTDTNVSYPDGEQYMDYELELAVVIGKQGMNISARDAMDYVGGYTVFNDFSARMTQLKDMGDPTTNVGPGISKDFANAIGPCMTTSDAFNWEDAKTQVRINGKVLAEGNHGEIYHRLPDIIEYVSSNVTLYPGDIIATGTVANCCGLETGEPLHMDDVIELEIEGIGTLRNTVVPGKPQKMKNKKKIYKRSVCAPVDGKSTFVLLDDYPDTWKTLPTTADVWRVNEMPARDSATFKRDMGLLPIEHEAPKGGSTLRHVQQDQTLSPSIKNLSEKDKKRLMSTFRDLHRVLGTHEIPTEADMQKHITMHRTDSLNLFICGDSEGFVALNDLEDVHLEVGDTLIQMAGMHGWDGKGVIGGLLVSANMGSFVQLTEKPKSQLKSKLNKFKRYVTATMKSNKLEKGESDIVIDDYSPNETEIYDANNKHIGYAGDIWKTFAADADVSAAADTITGPLEDAPPKSGITLRMVELLPGCQMETNKNILNYYCVAKGVLTGKSQTGAATAGNLQDIIQLKDADMVLANEGNEPAVFAHFMIDAE